MTESADTQAFACMDVVNVMVGYMHGEGSTISRDTAGHATAIASLLSEAGLLIARGHEVAISPERLNELKHAEATLAALTAAGVDNWEGYDDAIAELHSAGEDAKFGNVV